MNAHLWNVVREDSQPDWHFVRDSKRQIVCGPLRKAMAVEIAAAHNNVVMAMMETIAEGKAPRAQYDGMGA